LDPISSTNDLSKLAKLIEGIPVAMLTTIEPDGKLRARPMASPYVEFDGELWFFTGEHTTKVEDIRRYPQVNITFVSPQDNRYIAVMGRAQIVTDPIKKAELWSEAYKAWFPKGLEDPDLTLMKVTADRAEYWDSAGSFMVQLLDFASRVSGGRPRSTEQGEQKKLH
jgi:general stress protein 26